jgi:hypothetical protein
MFATGIATGVSLDRDQDERVNRCARALSGFERRAVGSMMRGVFAVADQDEDAACVRCESLVGKALARERDGIVQRGGMTVVNVTERGVDASGIAGKGCPLGNRIGESDEGDPRLLPFK